MKKRLSILFFPASCVLLFSLFSPARAQDSFFNAAPYYTPGHYGAVLAYLQHNGTLTLRHPLVQPYSAAELQSGLKTAKAGGSSPWLSLLDQDIGQIYSSATTEYTGNWHLGAETTLRRFAGPGHSFGQYRVDLYGTFVLPYLVLANRTFTDQQLKADPTFHGDTGEWIYGRVQDSYALFKHKAVQLFAGRVSRNMGIINEPSLILSDNPYSYDHFGFQVSTARVNFQFYTTRLNNMIAFDSQAADSSPQEVRRYFSVQRGDLKLRHNLTVGLAQVAIYGGPDRVFDPNFLNPMNLYYVNQRNNRSQISGLWALDLYWKPDPRVTLYTQLMVDDIIVNNEPGQDDRAVHPGRDGVAAKAIWADVFFPGALVSLTYNRISNWAYMSFRTWENYVYQKRGLGYPENAVESVRLDVDYLGKPPFVVHSSFGYRRHGEQNIMNVFGDKIEKFPRGVVEHSRNVLLKIQYLPSAYYNFELYFSHETFTNKSNVLGNSASDYMFGLAAHFSWSWGFEY